MEILASRMLFRPVDYQRSLSFYRDQIGLAIFRDYGAGTVFYAGQSLIELADHGAPEDSAGAFPARCGFRCAMCVATQTELESRGVTIAREARQEPWGLHEMHVVDPDGVTADLRPDSAGSPAAARYPRLTRPSPEVNPRRTSDDEQRYTLDYPTSFFRQRRPLPPELGP